MLQLIDMTPGEIQWLSSHLGHDVTTHKGNYRLHAPAIEITKVGRLLMAVDGGNVPSSRHVACGAGDRENGGGDMVIDVLGKSAAGRRRRRVASGDGDGQNDDGDVEVDVPRKPAVGRRRRRVASGDGDGQNDDGDVEVDVPGTPAVGRRRRRVASGDGVGQDDDGDETERRRLPGLFS